MINIFWHGVYILVVHQHNRQFAHFIAQHAPRPVHMFQQEMPKMRINISEINNVHIKIWHVFRHRRHKLMPPTTHLGTGRDKTPIGIKHAEPAFVRIHNSTVWNYINAPWDYILARGRPLTKLRIMQRRIKFYRHNCPLQKI